MLAQIKKNRIENIFPSAQKSKSKAKVRYIVTVLEFLLKSATFIDEARL